jgi:hypothetical protein
VSAAGSRIKQDLRRQFGKPAVNHVLRHGGAWPSRASGEFLPFLGISADGEINHTSTDFRDSPHKGFVDSGDRMLFELQGEVSVRLIVFSHDHDAGRFFIETMDEARPFLPANG